MQQRERFKFGSVELEIFTDTGPRVIGLYAEGVKGNLLVETPDIVQDTPHGPFYLRGGHRLWEAPERLGISGLPDTKVEVKASANGVSMIAAPNAIGIGKRIDIVVEGSKLTLEHRLSNAGALTFTMAPWAITQLAPGGSVWVPMGKAVAGEDKMPDRNLVLWPYSEGRRTGVSWEQGGLRFDPAKVGDPFKFGTCAASGRVEVRYTNYAFTKIFDAMAGAHYPDRGCNLEFYATRDYLEVETLGPLQELMPGGELRHQEIWEIAVK